MSRREDSKRAQEPQRVRTLAPRPRQTARESHRMKKAPTGEAFSIVAVDKFIHATRDSGYKGTSSAIAELVDNALQATATCIRITIAHTAQEEADSIEVVVQDDGTGMDAFTLRHALRFGGSTRFNDRLGLGRYGMGLPNSSLSQARRVTVYTWRSPRDVYMSYLDVDEIAAGEKTEVPAPRRVDSPPMGVSGKSGTLVAWSRCDRLDNRRVSTLARKLTADLGRRFRHFLLKGVRITVNGDFVEPIDPLFLLPGSRYVGASLFGQPIDYEVQVDPTGVDKSVGRVRVTFSELPVHEWHKLSNEEKRNRGISKGAGVSVVRAGREVDHGWFFMGAKVRENYDDWWRCEIQFEPVLDEAFGITHTKQQIRPRSYLLEALAPDIEAAARALNTRARKAHLSAKDAERFAESETLAAAGDMLLMPLPKGSRARDEAVLEEVRRQHPALRKSESRRGSEAPRMAYKIVEASVRSTSFFTYARQNGCIVLVLNPDHPFYKSVYKELVDSDLPRDKKLRTQLELVLLAAARAEASEDAPKSVAQLERQRQLWSDTLATFLNGRL